MTTKEYADGLRLIAEWYDSHPEAPVPHHGIEVFTVHDKDTMMNVARWLGRSDKRLTDSLFYLSRDFGAVSLVFVSDRATVCERRVVGTVDVPERIEPAHTKEVVEWDCHPLLAPGGEAA